MMHQLIVFIGFDYSRASFHFFTKHGSHNKTRSFSSIDGGTGNSSKEHHPQDENSKPNLYPHCPTDRAFLHEVVWITHSSFSGFCFCQYKDSSCHLIEVRLRSENVGLFVEKRGQPNGACCYAAAGARSQVLLLHRP